MDKSKKKGAKTPSPAKKGAKAGPSKTGKATPKKKSTRLIIVRTGTATATQKPKRRTALRNKDGESSQEVVIKQEPIEVPEDESGEVEHIPLISADELRKQMKGKISSSVQTLVNQAEALKTKCCRRNPDGSHTNECEMHMCTVCGKMFKNKQNMERHMKTAHYDGATYECDICGTKCYDKGTFARHMYIHTGLKPYHCAVCMKQFSRKYHLDRHMNLTKCAGAPPPAFPCDICGKEFTRKDNLREHIRAHAGVMTRKKEVVCDICDKTFLGTSLLTIHKRSHTGERPYKCDFCEKTFPTQGAQRKHRRVHTGERPYTCKQCGARFALKGTLNRHVRTHTGQKPHRCEFCGKQFIQPGGLKAHLFHHTGENGFPCDMCGKNFNRKARLDMHVRYVHTQVRPFECADCNKSFVRKEDLNRHSILHSGVKAYTCPTCNKSFAIKPSLKIHMLTHTREEPKACHECGRAYIRQDCLLRHIRKRHRDMLETISIGESNLRSLLEDRNATDNRLMSQDILVESVKELLTLLVDEPTLKSFGWPNKPIDTMMEEVIKRCGHTPVNSEDYTFADRLRENCKLLFAVVLDDSAVKTMLNNETVDEVILHVLHLAKT